MRLWDAIFVACRIEGKEGAPIRIRLNGETIDACGSYVYEA